MFFYVACVRIYKLYVVFLKWFKNFIENIYWIWHSWTYSYDLILCFLFYTPILCFSYFYFSSHLLSVFSSLFSVFIPMGLKVTFSFMLSPHSWLIKSKVNQNTSFFLSNQGPMNTWTLSSLFPNFHIIGYYYRVGLQVFNLKIKHTLCIYQKLY